ncbi:hypothetical protein GDO78_007034 [Eleutherodactylus coqui]|uniref:Uncharacterized protein n=1 Tax=Eleutherodactylus coqui TaxID=57060 RepID=A0A8J6FHW5_ELECQ|nr:hypothetical protein GDO78_007034 [Eleutherodactylus coqui]
MCRGPQHISAGCRRSEGFLTLRLGSHRMVFDAFPFWKPQIDPIKRRCRKGRPFYCSTICRSHPNCESWPDCIFAAAMQCRTS